MSRKRKNVTNKDTERWASEWLKDWEKGIFRSFFDVLDVPSLGRSRRIKSTKTGRVHQLLSDLEYYVFLELDFDKSVLDIHEQFPLLPREKTIALSHELEIKHPRYPVTQVETVMTTDFCVKRECPESGKTILEAYSVKYASALDKEKCTERKLKRTQEKLELEKAYWNSRNISWLIITDELLNRTRIENLIWLFHCSRKEPGITSNISSWLNAFNACLQATTCWKLKTLLYKTAEICGVTSNTSVYLFKYLVWHQVVLVDLTKPLNLLHEYASEGIGINNREGVEL